MVLPTPEGIYRTRVSRIIYPTISKDEYNIEAFPDEFEHLIMLGACLKAKQYMISRANIEEDIELATSHSNHLNLLRQDYQTSLQIVTSGLAQSQQEKAQAEA